MNSRWTHLALHVHSLSASIAFYERYTNLRVIERHSDASGTGMEVIWMGLVVENLNKTLAELKARNVQIAFGPYPTKAEAMSNFIIKDNAGYLIQFFGK